MTNKIKKGIFKKKKKYFTILLVCIVTGFFIGFSYNLSKDNKNVPSVTSMYYQQTESYRADLIEQQESNLELENQLAVLQDKIRQYEREFKNANNSYEEKFQEAESLRLALGEIAGSGKGISITLSDSHYKGELNPNEYIVHESHIFNVIQELKISGAEAISINGQRLKVNSYVSCNGPVITVDGNQYPAPFVIEAVGNQDTLMASLELTGGVVDQLLAENIVVTLEKKGDIKMPTTNYQGNRLEE